MPNKEREVNSAASPTRLPKVSVITPAFNSERTIDRCIRSVQKQTFRNWEQIVIDDKSGDQTNKIAGAHAARDSRVRLITLESNVGAGPARNAGIRAARGRYIAFLDADDEWYANKLERVLGYMAETGAAFTYHDYNIMNESGAVVAFTNAPSRMGYKDLLRNTAIGCLTVVIDRERIEVPEMPAIPVRQPLVAWLSILRSGLVAEKVQGIHAVYHRSKGSISSNKARAVLWTWRVYRRYEGFSRSAAARCLVGYGFNSIIKNAGWGARRESEQKQR